METARKGNERIDKVVTAINAGNKEEAIKSVIDGISDTVADSK